MNATQVLLLLLIGLLGGILAGTLGVGGGLIIVPSLVFIMGMTQHQSQGTSLTMMLAPIGLLGAWNYFREGYVNIRYAVILALAFVIGAFLGSVISIHITGSTLRKIFGILMLVAGIKMILGK